MAHDEEGPTQQHLTAAAVAAGVEISVVGSPVIFGGPLAISDDHDEMLTTATSSSPRPIIGGASLAAEERVIERHPLMTIAAEKTRPSIVTTAPTSGNNSNMPFLRPPRPGSAPPKVDGSIDLFP